MRTRLVIAVLAVFSIGAAVVASDSSRPADAGVIPAVAGDFELDTVFGNLFLPTAVAVAGDGHAFVAQKGGEIFIADSLGGNLSELYSVASETNTNTDRGLLGLTVHPNFGMGMSMDYVYALYTYDPGDVCDDGDGSGVAIDANPGVGCIADGKLIRIEVNTVTNQVIGSPVTLIQDRWCIEYSTHSIGDLEFGPDGYLYVSGGDGAGFDAIDTGDGATNPGCPDATNEGGALRSQDLHFTADPTDPTDYAGTLLRIDPITGAAAPGNPLLGGSTDDDRILAYGLRNPFRFGIRPSTGDIYQGDVGWANTEEINVIDVDGGLQNFGWPCYEGAARQGVYEAAALAVCTDLYNGTGGTAPTAPWYQYPHDPAGVNGSDGTGGTTLCDGGTASVSGVEFYRGDSNYPSQYDGAMFFADFSARCAWAVLEVGGVLDENNPVQILDDESIVDVARNPGTGDLLMVDIGLDAGGGLGEGRVLRLGSGDLSPVASITTSSTNPPLNSLVTFSAAGSGDPDGTFGALSFAWDLDDDGSFDDDFDATAQRTFTTPGTYDISVRVTDGDGLIDTATVTVFPGNTPPVVSLSSNNPSGGWEAGDTVRVTASATDAEEGTLPASAFDWDVTLQHCEFSGSCHSHFITSASGVSFLDVPGQSHEYPSFLQVTVEATDGSGQTSAESIDIEPATSELRLDGVPGGVTLAAGVESAATPFVLEVITGSTIPVIAPTTAAWEGVTFDFDAWSNGGSRSQNVTVNSDVDLVASYASSQSKVFGICSTPSPPFVDVPATSFAKADIDCIFNLGITTGTSSTTYSPGDFVTREQMAAFLARLYAAVTGSQAPVVTTPFTDVAIGSFARDDIARIFGLGITTGTSATTYSPGDFVTREQMAAFLARLYFSVIGSQAPVVTMPFGDVAIGSFARDDIARIFGLGITTGTSATTYSPGDNVTREQMGSFLARLFVALLT